MVHTKNDKRKEGWGGKGRRTGKEKGGDSGGFSALLVPAAPGSHPSLRTP